MLDREFEQYLQSRGGAATEKTKGHVLWAFTVCVIALPIVAYIIKIS